MAQSEWPWRKRPVRRRDNELPSASVISNTMAVHKLIDLLGSNYEALVALKALRANGLEIVLRDGSSLMADSDGNIIKLERS